MEKTFKKFIELTEEQAKEFYCKSKEIYISNHRRNLWKIPASRKYSSHASMEDLFYRGIPYGEGETKFYLIK